VRDGGSDRDYLYHDNTHVELGQRKKTGLKMPELIVLVWSSPE